MWSDCVNLIFKRVGWGSIISSCGLITDGKKLQTFNFKVHAMYLKQYKIHSCYCMFVRSCQYHWWSIGVVACQTSISTDARCSIQHVKYREKVVNSSVEWVEFVNILRPRGCPWRYWLFDRSCFKSYCIDETLEQSLWSRSILLSQWDERRLWIRAWRISGCQGLYFNALITVMLPDIYYNPFDASVSTIEVLNISMVKTFGIQYAKTLLVICFWNLFELTISSIRRKPFIY